MFVLIHIHHTRLKIHYIVVTEFGVARIKDLPVKERGRALVEIAAPEFRDELLADPLFD